MDSLGKILASNACLREFRLTDFILPSCMMSVAEGLLDNSTLCTLDLTGSIWGDKQATASALAVGLRGNQGLRTLNISRCDLHDSQLEVLIMALSRHFSLLWLDLANNSFGTKAMSALTSLLVPNGDDDESNSKPSTRLAGLTMTSCGVTDDVAVRLATALRHNTTLEHLHLSENCITDRGIQLFAAELRNLKTLKTLDLFQNEFSAAGAKYLLEALETNVELNHLLVDRHLKYYDEIQYQTCLNRGGRRFLAASAAPFALWPLVLERCQNIAFFYREKRVGREDILFYLLHGPVLFDNNAQHPTTAGKGA
jgi:Ran GTPase-activating protein (RanGAP) involved in mRNA processing and transport